MYQKVHHVLTLTSHSAATNSAISSLATHHLQCQISILHMVSQYHNIPLIATAILFLGASTKSGIHMQSGGVPSYF